MKATRWLTIGIAVLMTMFWHSPGQAAFVDNGNGTVSDTVTGLMWQKGDSQNDAGGRTWEEALNYCECLTLPSGGYSDWRLPNVRELETLVDWDRYNPAINPLFSCRSSHYWSSSTYADGTADAWNVGFYGGYVDGYGGKAYDGYVRCVRGGPSGSFDHFVEPLGICGGKRPCYTTIQAALNASGDGDTILVRHGDYDESILLDEAKSLKLLCGRADDFGPSPQFSTTHDLEVRRGSLTVEGLQLVGE